MSGTSQKNAEGMDGADGFGHAQREPNMYKRSSITIYTALSLLCVHASGVAQVHPSDDQAARIIRTSVTTKLEPGQLTDRIAEKYAEFRLIKEAGQLARQGEAFEDVASVRILNWLPFNASGGYWPVDSCVVFALHVYPTTSEHNVAIKMRFKVSQAKEPGNLKVEHLAPPSDATAASVKCELHAHPYLRGRG
jgi:hypothetical protein